MIVFTCSFCGAELTGESAPCPSGCAQLFRGLRFAVLFAGACFAALFAVLVARALA